MVDNRNGKDKKKMGGCNSKETACAAIWTAVFGWLEGSIFSSRNLLDKYISGGAYVSLGVKSNRIAPSPPLYTCICSSVVGSQNQGFTFCSVNARSYGGCGPGLTSCPPASRLETVDLVTLEICC